MGIGKQRYGLYYLDRFLAPSVSSQLSSNCNSTQYMSCVTSTCTNDDIDIWHRRFGHLSVSRLQCLPFIKHKALKSHCSICPMAKQTRKTFPIREHSTSTHAFQLLHIDIRGPFRTPTHTGARYFLTIVDDFSRCTWVFLMQFKFDTLHALKQFFTFVSNQFDHKVQSIRTDNALDFFNNECKTYFNSLGIFHQSSCPYTPQQNGLVERNIATFLILLELLSFKLPFQISAGEIVYYMLHT